jgi:hypothetical protein
MEPKMNVRIPLQSQPIGDPIELMQRFVDINDWRLHHASADEISVEIPGKWSDYTLTLTYQDRYAALHVNVMLDIFIIEQQLDAAREVIATLNENIWMGHFDLITKDGVVYFRHNLPLRGTGGATPEQMEDLVDIALGECERAYPALFQIASGGVSAEIATACVLMETIGSA